MTKHRQVTRIHRRASGAAAAVAIAAAGLLACGFVAPAQAGSGWQGTGTFAVPTGQTSQFVHMSCPTAFPRVWNGAFAMNNIGQTSEVYLAFNGPRIDETPPDYTEWGWHFFWPAGAPAGIVITFDVFCHVA